MRTGDGKWFLQYKVRYGMSSSGLKGSFEACSELEFVIEGSAGGRRRRGRERRSVVQGTKTGAGFVNA